MRKYCEENERIKRRYLRYIKEAKRQDVKSVDKAAAAIFCFEESTGFKPFKKFHIEQAIAFKRKLEAAKNERTGKPLSKATVDATLRLVKAFIHWLAGQSGYKSRISYDDAEYFNNSAKDARIAHAQREAPFPTMAQLAHAFAAMPNETQIQRRDKALFAFLVLTGARVQATASLRLKRIDLVEGCVYQDARDVQTKGAKTFQTYFLPVDPAYLACFTDWVSYLRNDLLFGHEDALFPKPKMGCSDEGGFAVIGLSRDNWSNGTKIRDIIKTAFTTSGLPAFGPHSFRKTLVKFGVEICQTPEVFKAWSLNMGHDSVVTTLSAYCPISINRQKELIQGMAPNPTLQKVAESR